MSDIIYDQEARRKFTIANLKAWDEVAPAHAKANQEKLLKKFSEPGFVTLAPHVLDRLREVGVEEKVIAQLCCNNGRELLSLKNLGAGKCVGFDISAEFIAQANALKAVTVHDQVRFVTSDVYDIPSEYDHQFDIVMNTIGVISWMPNLQQLFEVYARLVKPSGTLFIEEMHPVLMMYEEGEGNNSSGVEYSYFKKDPLVFKGDLDYYTNSDYGDLPNYSFQHTLAEIMMAAIDAGFTLRHFAELDFDIANFCMDLETADNKPPLGMTMVWQKG